MLTIAVCYILVMRSWPADGCSLAAHTAPSACRIVDVEEEKPVLVCTVEYLDEDEPPSTPEVG